MYDPMEIMEQEADTIYRDIIAYELARNMSIAFVERFPPGDLKMAALSVATARFDAVRRDVDKGKLSLRQVFHVYDMAVKYKVTSQKMAEHQKQLCIAIKQSHEYDVGWDRLVFYSGV